MSVGQAWFNKIPVFWEAPINLPDTETIDLWSDEVCINGSPMKGFTFLKTFTGGIELYGLRNWGMPIENDNELQLLHGETSNIPVNEISIYNKGDILTVQASFLYRTFKGSMQLPWYERGDAIYRVEKNIILQKDAYGFSVIDIIENVSPDIQIPDWGYHITFKPEEGTRLLIPSHHTEERGCGPLPLDIETWHMSKNPDVRKETGIIFKNLLTTGNDGGATKVNVLLLHPDGRGIILTVPPSPYFQSWSCCGGKGSTEFTFKNGQSLLQNNWDGLGIEIGSSPLDHNGNIDKSVDYKQELKPGEKIKIEIGFKWNEN